MKSRTVDWLIPVALGTLAAVPFLPALNGEFTNWDDQANFINNEGYRGLGWSQLRWMFTSTLLGHYIPLTWLSFGVNYALGGLRPWDYHAGNLLLHGANVGLFYVVARRLLKAALADPLLPPSAIAVGAATAALLFGVHPLRVESVAWITERRDVLCGFFYLLAVLAYLAGAVAGGRVGGTWLVWSLAAFVGALLSKAMAVTLPFTLLLLDTYPLRRWGLGWRAVLSEKTPYALLSALGAVTAISAVHRGAAWTGYDSYGPRSRLAMVAYSLWFYPSSLIWAHDLSPLYELPVRLDILDGRFFLALLAVVLTTVILIGVRRACPGGLTAWLHSAIVLSPVMGVVHAGFQLAHDRYSYLSGLGFALLGGGGLSWAIGRWRRRVLHGWVLGVAIAGAGLVAVGLSVGTWRQSKIWLTSESLWRAAVAADAQCAVCRNNLGVAIVRASESDPRRLAEAAGEFRQAIALRPTYPDPYANLGALLARQGLYGEAEPVLRAYARAFPWLPDGALRLGMLLRDQGRDADAVALLRRALAMSSGAGNVRLELGHALSNQGARLVQAGRRTEATALFEEASALLPEDGMPRRNLGQVLVEEGHVRDAIGPLQEAVRLDPRDKRALYWLIRAYRGAGEFTEAQRHIAVLRALDRDLAARAERDR